MVVGLIGAMFLCDDMPSKIWIKDNIKHFAMRQESSLRK